MLQSTSTIVARSHNKSLNWLNFCCRCKCQMSERNELLYCCSVHSIINGFALPLKQEHRQFLFKVLMPLHQSNAMNLFHAQVCAEEYLTILIICLHLERLVL